MDNWEVLTMRQVAFLFSQSVCALAEIEGMKAENMMRESRGEAMAFTYDMIAEVPQKYGIHHNSAVTLLNVQG